MFKKAIYQNLVEYSNNQEPVWNLFVQILLPLIMVLTFSSVTLVLKYKNLAEDATKDLKQMEDIFRGDLEDFDPDKTLEGAKKITLKYQIQKLLLALKKIEMEQRTALELDRYKFHQNIHIEDTKLNDNQFKNFCGHFRETVFTKNFDVKRSYYEKIYTDILNKATVIDKNINNVQFVIVDQDVDEIIDKEYLKASERIIIKQVRLWIVSEIVKLINSFIREIITLQKDAVLKTIEAMIENPEDLSPESKLLIEKFMKETNEGRAQAMADFYRGIMEIIIQDLDSYNILPNVISEIDSI